MPHALITAHPRLDALLDDWRDALNQDYTAYRHHCYRVLNFFALLSNRDDAESLDKAAIAAAFHDIGLWSHDTLDYLEPSASLALAWLEDNGLDAWRRDVLAMIIEHHKVTPCADIPLAEAFRQADWTDVTQGARRFGLPWREVRRVQKAFPNAGFHRMLVRRSLRQLREDPKHPLPMFRW